MSNILVKEYTIPVSGCDNSGKLSIPAVFDLFMDLATEHAALLNIGMDTLSKKGCFWVAAKTRIEFDVRPRMLQTVTASSWPEKPGNIRYNRYYTVKDGEDVIIKGKTEWTILDMQTMKPKKSSEVYPQDIVHPEGVVCEEPFSRISTDFSDSEEMLSYTVTSRDIDVSQHMNNVAYIRAVLSSFTCKEIEDMSIRQVEVAYRLQCYEGEKLSVRRRNTEDGIEIGIIKEDGKTATTMKLVCGS